MDRQQLKQLLLDFIDIYGEQLLSNRGNNPLIDNLTERLLSSLPSPEATEQPTMFTEEEIREAMEVKKKVMSDRSNLLSNTSLKSIYKAGEINMYLDLKGSVEQREQNAERLFEGYSIKALESVLAILHKNGVGAMSDDVVMPIRSIIEGCIQYGIRLQNITGAWKYTEEDLAAAELLGKYSQTEQGKDYEVDFAGHFKCQIEIKNNEIKIWKAMNGYGDAVDPATIIISPLPSQPKQ